MKKLSFEEVKEMKLGSVIWAELHNYIEPLFGENVKIYYCEVIPMMITEPGINGCIGWIVEDRNLTYKINKELFKDKDKVFWDERPEIITRDGEHTLEEALKAQNQIEEDFLAMRKKVVNLQDFKSR